MNSGGSDDDWEVIDSGETYSKSVERCGGEQLVQNIFAAVEYALTRNPFGFVKTEAHAPLTSALSGCYARCVHSSSGRARAASNPTAQIVHRPQAGRVAQARSRW